MTDITALQAEIYTVLNQALPEVSIYDDVPETADTPYIVIGEDSVSDGGAKVCEVDEVTVTISVFSSYKGMKEVKELSSRIAEALKTIKVSGDNAYIQYLRLENIEHNKDSDDMRSAEIEVVFLVS